MRLSIIAIVSFALLLVFSLYAVVYTQSLPTERQSTVTLASYEIQGNYVYKAALKPNALYNATVLEMGNGSLFVSITRSINVSFTCTLSLSEPTAVSLNSSYLVTLSGGSWNKTLARSTGTTQQGITQSAAISKSFNLNMTQILSLAKEIETQLQYSPPSYVVQIRPVITGSLVRLGRITPLIFMAPLNLTISNGVISPTGTSYVQQSNLTSSVEQTDSLAVQYRYLSYVLLSGSLLLLAVSAFYVSRPSKKEPEDEAHEIEARTRPYREAIASARSPPVGDAQVVMETWEDLLKVADTLGKPILEFHEEGAGELISRTFWVLDGETTYRYEFRATRHENQSRDS
jgi:hypothetical protein